MRPCIRQFLHKTGTKSYWNSNAIVPTTTPHSSTSGKKVFTTIGRTVGKTTNAFFYNNNKNKPTLSCRHTPQVVVSSQPMVIRNQRHSITSTARAGTAAAAASTTSAPATDSSTTANSNKNDQKHNKKKTPGDIFLDNLGTLFLSAIGLLILALVRSSKGTTNKNNLRSLIETCAALDPFEIDDLRTANDEFTVQVFRDICGQLLGKKYGWRLEDEIDYKLFVSAVMQEMKGMKGEQFTIQLGHLMDRVIVSIVEEQQQGREQQGREQVQEDLYTEKNDDPDTSVTSSQGLELRLLLVVLSLALNSTVRERVEVLYDILGTHGSFYDDDDDGNDAVVDEHSNVQEKDVIKMVGYLQKTCQLPPDAQIVESKTKFPVQEYLVGSPRELVILGKESKKEELMSSNTDRGWSCDDVHHLLRSRNVCAWGECYVKTKSLM
jgi:hypothetical protein